MSDKLDFNDIDKPHICLIIKRSELASNLQNHGTSCIISQKWFMALVQKAKFGNVNFELIEIDYRKPLPEYIRKNWSISRLPAVLVRWPIESKVNLNGSFIINPDKQMKEQLFIDSKEIESMILKLTGGPSLIPHSTAEKVISNVYMKFNSLLRSNHQLHAGREKALLTELVQIDNFLADKDQPFLCGDQLTLADCDLMPKLQHIRVAGEFYKDFTIPTELTYLWKYIERTYQLEAFRLSCPYDQDIVVHYQNKVLLPKQSLLRPTLQKLSITDTIPN